MAIGFGMRPRVGVRLKERTFSFLSAAKIKKLARQKEAREANNE